MLLQQLVILSAFPAMGQRVRRPAAAPKDTVSITPPQDSLTATVPKGDIETTIKYSARDSIQFEVERKVVHLYGDAKINYGTTELTAAYIQIDYNANTLTATTLVDSTGKEVGTPVFKDAAETYAAKKIAYNYKTKKGRIAEVVTQQGEGYIHSEVVKKNEQNEIFGLHNKYTTCNLEHPHFYISAGKIKAIPNDKIMSGPFNLVIADIPTPLGFLFGLFPTPRNKRSSGVIMPSFGESRARGFYLSNGGYYLALNDYIGTRITGDIYSLGGYRVTVDNTYINRYSYRGNFNISYDYFKNDEADVVDPSRSTTDRSGLPPTQRTAFVTWSHSPVQKPGRGRFSANVRAGSSQHNRVNYDSPGQYLTPTFNSTITYQKNIQNTPFSYTATLSQGQNNGGRTSDGRPAPTIMNFVLPDLNFAMTQMSVYEMFSKSVPTGRWYENFTFGYNLRARNEVSNAETARRLGSVPIIGGTERDTSFALNLENLDRLWKNGRKSADHNFQIGLGNYKVLRFFNLTPSVSYRESWFDNKLSYVFDPDSQKVRIDTAKFGRVYEYNAGASLNTTVYGTVNFKKDNRIQAIRHVMRPSIGYSYRPNFGDQDRFGFFQTAQVGVDTLTNLPVYQTLPRFNGNVPSGGLTSGMSISLQNNVEMKVRSKSDSAATEFEKVSLIDNLGISTFYNFASDSLRLSPINVNMNTRLLKLFDINVNSTFDPYQVSADGSRRIDRYMLEGSGFKPARLTNAQLSVRANFNPEARASNTPPPTNLPGMMSPIDPLMPDYVDFNIPWTLSLDYTIFYTARAPSQSASASNITQNLGMQGTVNFTEKWKVGYMAGYDFTNNNISNASIDIYRDLHCWEMSIGWRPFGLMRGYNVTINARSALLRDLKLSRNRSGMNYR